MVEAVVAGTWRADPADPYWLGDPLLLAGNEPGGSFRLVGPLVAEAADLTGPLAGSRPVDAQWRAIPDLAGFRPENLDQVATSLSGLPRSDQRRDCPGRTRPRSPRSCRRSSPRSTARSWSPSPASCCCSSSSACSPATRVILVAALLVDRRRSETALLRARGAGFGHLVRMAVGEALLIVAPAVLAAPWIATLLVAAVALNPALEGVGLTAPLPDAGHVRGRGDRRAARAAGARAADALDRP